MDFISYKTKPSIIMLKHYDYDIRPNFLYGYVKDVVTRGGSFYAFWDKNHWSMKINDLIKVIDAGTEAKEKSIKSNHPDAKIRCNFVSDSSSGIRKSMDDYFKLASTEDKPFNTKIMWSKDKVKREDYSTTKLSYSPQKGPTPNFDEMIENLYDKDNEDKILWCMGAALTNSMYNIQKFMYIYGGKGTGKGTVIDIIKQLFEDYSSEIDLSKLTSGSEFATSQIKELPILIDSDSDISRIKQDTNLLKLTAHEPIAINQKYQKQYEITFKGLLITASNQRYQSRNIDSGINRRAIVVEPSNGHVPYKKYQLLKAGISSEIPMIAQKAIDHYFKEGPDRYEKEVDVSMMEATDYIFAFVRQYSDQLGDPCTLKRASELYKEYLEDLGYETRGFKRTIRNELQRYYKGFYESKKIDGLVMRNIFIGFKTNEVFPERKRPTVVDNISGNEYGWISLNDGPSAFDKLCKDYPAQLANSYGVPSKKWDNNKTKLKDIDTHKLHFVLVPSNHIIVDFDLKDSNGEKDYQRNLIEASKFPPTYTEVSKSGKGIHLHYIYDGDVTKLSPIYSNNIEIKVYSSKESIRRKLTLSNDLNVDKLPKTFELAKKEEKDMLIDTKMIWTEKKIITAIEKNLRKEYHPATKPSIDFITSILQQAKQQGTPYDIRSMRQAVLVFAMNSTNHKKYCIDAVKAMPFTNLNFDEEHNVETTPEVDANAKQQIYGKNLLYFFDIEVYPNLLLVVFKPYGGKKTKWYNPTPEQIESLVKHPLVGFNNRKYDNHILYGRMLGEDNAQLYERSQNIINGNRDGFSSGAYNLAYADMYDYSSKKQSLKKWEIEMGIIHDEFELPWDKPLDKKDWPRAGEYCGHDVDASESLFDFIYSDYEARLMLAKLTGMPVCATTQQLAAKFIFGNDKHPQDKFVYTDLAKEFPGYKYSFGKSTYMGEDPSEGGYVYSDPGTYEHVAEHDISSMHPHSAIALNIFGPYTKRYAQLLEVKEDLKHDNVEHAKTLFNGELVPYLEDETNLAPLAHAVKIIINIVYGMTSAKFPNPFKDPRNVDNIVAKRGALFMITLKHECMKRGWKVVHIKTDSIKIANNTPEQTKFIHDFGEKYGYSFEVEHIFDKFALVNKAVLIGHIEDNPKWDKPNQWSAIGAEYAVPYVFKTLCTQESIDKEDYMITKSVKSAIYLGDTFIGKVARIFAAKAGKDVYRIDTSKDTKAFVTGTKGYKWDLEKNFKRSSDIDSRYYEGLVQSAVDHVQDVGDAEFIFGKTCVPYLKK